MYGTFYPSGSRVGNGAYARASSVPVTRWFSGLREGHPRLNTARAFPRFHAPVLPLPVVGLPFFSQR